MKRLFCGLRGLIPIVLLWCGPLFASDTAAFKPDLVFLAPPRADTAAAVDSSAPAAARFVTAKGAAVVSPALYSVIDDNTVTYEIAPFRPVDRATLFVKHSQTLVDTLGVFASPPYRAEWRCAGVPDQDQMHLQFGYVLHSGDTLVTTSPPSPHQWMLDRGHAGRKRQLSGKNYHIRQMMHLTFDLDGSTSKWNEVKSADIGDIGYFKMMWTGGKLFFMAQVRDSSITPGDFVELHVDMRGDRARFSGVNHRSLRFNPLGRSRSFVVELTDTGFVHADSVNAFIGEELEWKAETGDDGYVIEASIPFVALSGLGLPPAKFGIDVSVMNVDKSADGVDDGENVSYHSWTGTEQYFRYSPSGWGTAKTSQMGYTLRFAMMALIFLSCAAVVFIALNTIATERKIRKFDPIEDTDYSPVTDAVIKLVEERLTDANFGIGDAVKNVGKSKDEIEAALKKDMDATFEQLLAFKRVKRSQKLMREPGLTVEKIAEMCGFASADTYKKLFKAQMKVDPEVSRQAMLDKVREEERDRLEEEDD